MVFLKKNLTSLLVIVSLSSCFMKNEDYDVFAEQYDTLSWPANNISLLEITVVNGNVFTGAGNTSNITAVLFRRAWGIDFNDAEEHLSDIEVRHSVTGETFTLSADFPDINRKYISSFDLEVPQLLNLDYFGINGDYSVDDIIGDIKLRLSTGSMKCNYNEGALDLRINNGSISISNHLGDVHAETARGSVFCHMLGLLPECSVEIEALDGNVLVEVPEDASFSFEISTTLGKMHLEGFDSLSYETNQLYYRKGTVNGGDTPLKVVCGKGSITIRTAI